uniref:Uncharacterized protein n=1 Tax=Anguilla anguilla TaxID=7936 RepID=A0A0E9QI15_ANGAN
MNVSQFQNFRLKFSVSVLSSAWYL